MTPGAQRESAWEVHFPPVGCDDPGRPDGVFGAWARGRPLRRGQLRRFFLGVAPWFALALPAAAQVITDREPRWTSTDRVFGGAPELGKAVALSGGRLLLGAPQASHGPPTSSLYGTGCAVSYGLGLHGWSLEHRVDPVACFEDGAVDRCSFGRALRADGDRFFAPSLGVEFDAASMGLVHVYRSESTGPVLDQIVRLPQNPLGTYPWPAGIGAGSGRFAVGATEFGYPGEYRGRVFIYGRGPDGRYRLEDTVRGTPVAAPWPWWTVQSTLFGYAVDIDGGLLVVGDPSTTWINGRALVYADRDDRWELLQEFESPFGPTPFGAKFGAQVAVDAASGTIVVAHVPRGTNPAIGGQGRIWIYERANDASDFVEVATFTVVEPALGVEPANFGLSLDLEDGVLVVGSMNEHVDGHDAGCVHVFRRGAQGWARERRLAAPDDGLASPTLRTYFGASVDLDGDRVVVGEPRWGPAPLWSFGRGHVYELSRGTEVCRPPGGGPRLNVLYRGGPERRVTLSVFDLPTSGVGVFVVGSPGTAAPFQGGALCVAGAQRVSPVLGLSGEPALYHEIEHPDPTSPRSLAFQFVYTGGVSSARHID